MADIRTVLIIASGLIAILSTVPYIRDTLRGRTHPNVVSWFTWTLLNGINAAAAWSVGARQTAVFSLLSGMATGAIVVVGLRNGLKHYSRFDISCQAAALAGIILWQLTANPNVAVLVSLGADFSGFLPTYRHALGAPHEETWQLFALSACAAGLALLAVPRYSFIALASPLYIFCANMVMCTTILVLRRRVPAARVLQATAEA